MDMANSYTKNPLELSCRAQRMPTSGEIPSSPYIYTPKTPPIPVVTPYGIDTPIHISPSFSPSASPPPPLSMGSRSRKSFKSTPMPPGRTRRRSQSHGSRVSKPRKSSRIIGNGGANGCAAVSDKLEALKNLIPAHIDGEGIKSDELFQETADYIVLLRTQIFVLQKLINFYGCPQEEDQNAV